MKETAPCPWCTDGGRPFLSQTRSPALSYTVRCNVCFAQGPCVKIDAHASEKGWGEKMEAARQEATDKWNVRASR